jgi:hypothetical protein
MDNREDLNVRLGKKNFKYLRLEPVDICQTIQREFEHFVAEFSLNDQRHREFDAAQQKCANPTATTRNSKLIVDRNERFRK